MKVEEIIADLDKGSELKAKKFLQSLVINKQHQRDQLFTVAVMAGQQKMLTLASKCLYKILAWNPKDIDSINNLSVLLINANRYREGMELLNNARQHITLPAKLQANLALCHLRRGNYQQTVDILKVLIEQHPREATHYSLLAVTLDESGNTQGAITAYRRALECDPLHISTYLNLGQLLFKEKIYQQALMLVNFALKLDNNHCEGLILAGKIFNALENTEAAKTHFQRACELYPQNPVAAGALASLHIEQGDIEAANQAYGQVELDYNIDTQGLLQRSQLKNARLTEAEAATLIKLIDQGDIPKAKIAESYFAVSRYYEQQRDFEQDIFYLRKGNQRYYQQSRDAAELSTNSMVKTSQNLRQKFTAEHINAVDFNLDQPDQPIFIVGMPRSGSTLTEQIISAHPMVTSYGEVDCLGSALQENPIESKPSSIEEHRQALADLYPNLAASYRDKMTAEFGALARCYTDKQLFNYQYLGFIRGAFPQAKIIHCKRHPVDNCLGMFRQSFDKGNVEFSYDLKNIADVYISYTQLTDHWKTIFPGFILDAQYEDLVADPENQSRRIIDFCGLKWDDACLNFHQQKNQVKTGSKIQVREPIYKTAVAKWEPYEPYLQDLVGYLKEGGIEI